jgi:methionine-rich copper-binding protein CopC
MAMLTAPSRRSDRAELASQILPLWATQLHPASCQRKSTLFAVALALVSLALVAPILLRAQGTSPHITSVTPNNGKAEDTITITGENLSKDKVAAVFLSDSKLDHKATVVDQEPTKIVIKVPDNLKPGHYNISVQEGGAIYIQPVIFTVTT